MLLQKEYYFTLTTHNKPKEIRSNLQSSHGCLGFSPRGFTDLSGEVFCKLLIIVAVGSLRVL